jgi:membrane protein implicated in regulation of membrane protease activity
MDLDLYQWTLAIAIIFFALEIVSGSFLLLGFGIGLLPVAFLHFLTGSIQWGRDIMVFALVATVAFILLRKIFLKRGDSSEALSDINKY